MGEIIYLYYYQRYSGGVNRVEVERQTDHFYFTKSSKISKKRMQLGTGWDSTHYYLETPQLVEEYNKSQKTVKTEKRIYYLTKLIESKSLSVESMDKILNLDIQELK